MHQHKLNRASRLLSPCVGVFHFRGFDSKGITRSRLIPGLAADQIALARAHEALTCRHALELEEEERTRLRAISYPATLDKSGLVVSIFAAPVLLSTGAKNLIVLFSIRARRPSETSSGTLRGLPA
jgi:hypothetical protein